MKQSDITSLQPESFTYTPLFCEENIWLLCQKLANRGLNPEDMSALFLTNAARQTPVLQQKRSPNPDLPTWWDYHVVLQAYADTSYILDFDTRLPFAAPSEIYFQECFLLQQDLPDEQQIYLKKIPAAVYLQQFSSDRSHMRTEDGRPTVPFPDYPPITKGTLSLTRCLNLSCMSRMTRDIFIHAMSSY